MPEKCQKAGQMGQPATVSWSGLAPPPPERFRFLRSLLSVLGLLNLPESHNKEHTILKSFADLGISSPVVDALAERDITAPFPVQQMVVSDALAGHDLLVQSPTGAGRPLALGIPMVALIEPGQGLSGLVLAPTRELASQIVDELTSVARARGLRIAAVYGGAGVGPQHHPPPPAAPPPPSPAGSAWARRATPPAAPTSSSPPRAGSRTC